MSADLWHSTSDAYGRHVVVRAAAGSCMVCHKPETEALEVDTSDGEYLSFVCCVPCFSMFAARAA